jgi:zinc/manganese transport system substrate-binding protein
VRRHLAVAALIVIVIVIVIAAAACSTGSSPSSPGDKLEVVAAENFWGSIAAQLGGDRVDVTNIVSSPDTDPHDYEPTPQDARAVASAGYVIFNGLGYDAWAPQLVDANPVANRSVLDVGRLLGLHDGDNPHRWYFPGDVRTVIAQITTDYKQLDSANAAYYDARRVDYETNGLKRYDDLVNEIKAKYSGTPVGASESIFAGIADATGLHLVTPAGFITAVSEGADPSAQDKATVDQQITRKQVEVFVYNSQNATPDVQALLDEARASGVETTTVTETPPQTVSFQDWQADQLQGLADALARATGT